MNLESFIAVLNGLLPLPKLKSTSCPITVQDFIHRVLFEPFTISKASF
jgi:hypothetical protein